MNVSSRSMLAAFGACAILLTAGPCASPVSAQESLKTPITSAADVPRFTYPVAGTASGLVTADAATFNVFGTKVRADIERVLATYDIRDRATLRNLLKTKLALQMLSGTENAGARETAAQIRALEDKPDQKVLSGILTDATLDARADSGARSGEAFEAAFQKRYAAALASVPWSVAAPALKQSRTSLEVLTPDLMSAQIATSFDPAVAKTHEISGDAAASIVETRYYILELLPAKKPAIAVLGSIIAQHSVLKPDIWAARSVSLAAKEKLTPVRVAVWDSGVDVSLYSKQLFTDPHPGAFDAHGLAFDLQANRAHGTLMPLTAAQRKSFPDAVAFLEGYSDLQDSVDSPAAAMVKKRLAGMARTEWAAFFQNVATAGIYSHGTHVSGIALRGNPAARLVVARLTFDDKLIPSPPSEGVERRVAANMMTYVKYFRKHGVRIVNMSWGGSPSDIETALEKNALGKDADERKAMAARLFKIDRDGLYAALKSAPEILFVTSAGNSNGDAQFNETIPASFELPNLLVVGAVDQAGDETSFTSYGKTVRVDADGYHVESYVPGGARVKLSGTSMAAPNVVALAAKLLALDPHLAPEQTIALIEKGATASVDGRRHLIDEKATIATLRAHLTGTRAVRRGRRKEEAAQCRTAPRSSNAGALLLFRTALFR